MRLQHKSHGIAKLKTGLLTIGAIKQHHQGRHRCGRLTHSYHPTIAISILLCHYLLKTIQKDVIAMQAPVPQPVEVVSNMKGSAQRQTRHR